MLNLAIIALVALVASALWLLLRPPVSVVVEQTGPDDTAPTAASDSAEPPGPPGGHVVTPSQAEAPAHDR